jgi:hypothetical protein
MSEPARRVTFGTADPRDYMRGPLPEIARPGSVLALCAAPGDNPAHARARLARVEARGDPCFRCLANIAPRGSSPRCGFLESARAGFRQPEPLDPTPDTEPGDGFGL